MNYGWDSTCTNWKEARKQQLAAGLSKELELPIGNRWDGKPYIEVDELYLGVRIRKIGKLTEDARETLVSKAEEIYHQVMGAEK